jgi:DNA-binding CsgD family transcriptional regulator
MTSTTNNALAALRQIASLGQPPAAVFDDLVVCLQTLVPFDTASIILLNPDFSGRDALANFDLPAEVSLRYAVRWFNREEERFYPNHIRLQRDPALKVMRVSDFTPRLRETELYDEIMRHSDHHWIASLTTSAGRHPIGNLGLGRPAARRDFSREDLVLLEQARPFVEQALAAPPATPLSGGDGGSVETALLCADLQGRVLSESPNAWRMLRWARGVPLDASWGDNHVYDWSRPLLAELASRVRAALVAKTAPPAAMRSCNEYGEFILRAYALNPAAADRPFAAGIQVERRLPIALRLFRSPPFRALSNRERGVVLGLVSGATHGEIAARLGITPNTVVSHVRNLYARLEVNNRQGLIERLIPN